MPRMNQVIYAVIKYILIPAGTAGVMYVLVHLQFLLLHKLVDLDMSHKTRTKLNIVTFFSVMGAVFVLILVRDYLGWKAG
ncbi:MAG: hypothetical protein R6U32_03750 [Candidatus Woesearchaeota archaeon]